MSPIAAVNQEAVRLGIVTQEDADRFTAVGRSLQGKIDHYHSVIADGTDKQQGHIRVMRQAMWGDD